MMLTILAISPAAMGADSTDRASPLDSNAACMDRTTDASSANCVVKDEGTPRQTYPPKQSPANATPAPAPAAATPTVRKSATGK
jgi:hypothetical protein